MFATAGREKAAIILPGSLIKVTPPSLLPLPYGWAQHSQCLWIITLKPVDLVECFSTLDCWQSCRPACWIVTVNQPINGGHKNDSNSAASSPDHLHQIHKFYLFDKNFYIAHQHVSCTTTKYLKWKYVANYLICSLLWYRLSTPALLFVVNAHD